MARIAIAGTTYFALVFAIAFLLGIVRELWVRPRFGELPAVGLEAPVVLLASALVARWVVRRFALHAPHARLGVGAVGLVLLMLAELGGSMGLRGLSGAAWLAHLATPAGLLSLAMFAAFAAMPLLAGRVRG